MTFSALNVMLPSHFKLFFFFKWSLTASFKCFSTSGIFKTTLSRFSFLETFGQGRHCLVADVTFPGRMSHLVGVDAKSLLNFSSLVL